MHGMEVQTAARYRLPIVYVVLNNAALGNVWLHAHQYGPLPSELTTLPDHDWAGFALAFGAQGMTVTDPAALEETFAKALAANVTVVIDVKADKDCPTPVYDFSAGSRAQRNLVFHGANSRRRRHGRKIPQQASAMAHDFTSHLSLGLGLYIGARTAGLI